MVPRNFSPATALIAVALVGVGVLAAQSDDAPKTSFSRLLNIDALIDNHARFLARRYNLSEEQEAYTLAFLHKKADGFLQVHRDEMYDLVDRLVEVRAGADIDGQELGRWGQRAQPLYEEAKLLIIDGNNQWREILTDDQKKIHDDDLREMYESFNITEGQLQRIVGGQMTVDEFRRGPGQAANSLRGVSRAPMRSTAKEPGSASINPTGPQGAGSTAPSPSAIPQTPAPPKPAAPTPTTPQPPPAKTRHASPSGEKPEPSPTPARPASEGGSSGRPDRPRSQPEERGKGPRGSVPSGSTDFEGQWEQYVREFIAKYQLDDAQSQRAWSILKDCREAARRVVDKRKSELERLDKKLQSLATDAKDADKLKELTEVSKQRTKLLEPVGEIFEKQLKPRLERLPTRAQRLAADDNAKKTPGSPGKRPDAGQRPPRQPQPGQPPMPPQPEQAPEPPQPVEEQQQPPPPQPDPGVGP